MPLPLTRYQWLRERDYAVTSAAAAAAAPSSGEEIAGGAGAVAFA